MLGPFFHMLFCLFCDSYLEVAVQSQYYLLKYNERKEVGILSTTLCDRKTLHLSLYVQMSTVVPAGKKR